MDKIHAKYKFICEEYDTDIENRVNEFLSQLDVRQIVKMETTVDKNYNFCAITYIPFEDIRNSKIQNILD